MATIYVLVPITLLSKSLWWFFWSRSVYFLNLSGGFFGPDQFTSKSLWWFFWSRSLYFLNLSGGFFLTAIIATTVILCPSFIRDIWFLVSNWFIDLLIYLCNLFILMFRPRSYAAPVSAAHEGKVMTERVRRSHSQVTIIIVIIIIIIIIIIQYLYSTMRSKDTESRVQLTITATAYSWLLFTWLSSN